MNGLSGLPRIRHALGVYVLGAIDPAERRWWTSTLSICPDCREELAGLAGLPALLRRIPVGEAQQLADDDLDELPGAEVPSEEMLRSLAGPHDAGPARPRRWRGLAAAAAVVLVAGAAGAAGWSAMHHTAGGAGSSVVPAHFTSATATNPATQVAATVRYAAKGWGTVLDTQVKNVPNGARCQLVVTDSSGHHTVVGGWTTTYDEGSVW